MSLHLKLLDVDHPLTFEESKLRQIEAHALIYLSTSNPNPSPRVDTNPNLTGLNPKTAFFKKIKEDSDPDPDSDPPFYWQFFMGENKMTGCSSGVSFLKKKHEQKL